MPTLSAAKEAVCLKRLLNELARDINGLFINKVDNQDAMKIAILNFTIFDM